jgi:tripeptide aminopeptidase
MDLASYINRNRLTETFIELISINSPPFGEGQLGALLMKKLQKAGCSVAAQEYRQSFNLIGRKAATRQGFSPILLNAHMDTIEPTEGIAFEVTSEVVRSTGTTVLGADDKSALAQILEAVEVISERSIPHGDIEIVFTSAEEKGLCGARNLDMRMLGSRHALVLDSCGSVGRIVTAAPAHHTYTMHITGKAAHAGIEPEQGISAIRVAARIIAEVPDGRIDAETTANIGVITGGTATNVVPKEATIRGEVRSHDRARLDSLKDSIFKTARAAAASHGTHLSISEEEEYEAFRIREDDPFLRYLQEVFRSCGIEPCHVTTGGGSDANVFNHRGITAINISTGMEKVHSNEERISLQDLYQGSLVVLRAIADFGGFPGDRAR